MNFGKTKVSDAKHDIYTFSEINEKRTVIDYSFFSSFFLFSFSFLHSGLFNLKQTQDKFGMQSKVFFSRVDNNLPPKKSFYSRRRDQKICWVRTTGKNESKEQAKWNREKWAKIRTIRKNWNQIFGLLKIPAFDICMNQHVFFCVQNEHFIIFYNWNCSCVPQYNGR